MLRITRGSDGDVIQPEISEIQIKTFFQKACMCGHSHTIWGNEAVCDHPLQHVSSSSLANLYIWMGVKYHLWCSFWDSSQ